jgi:glucosamine--fructose-6-phosphate aminotransferase (isomerizing)
MCGIIGCVNDDVVAPILLQGLKHVEYRGYDSAGIATINGGTLRVRKGAGKVAEIEQKFKLSALAGTTGIAHTRWATHGGVTDRNAHPQTSCREGVAIVHNGIIENYIELRKGLRGKGHLFKSETDSEVIAHLIEQEYEKLNDPTKATISAAKKLTGQYAFAAIFQDRPGVIVGARKDAPLLIGVAEGKKFIASDVLAFIEHTDRTIFLDNLEVAEVTKDDVRIFKLNGRVVKRKPTQVAWELSDLSKLDYAHYTLKEIHEQPRTIINAGLQNEERLGEFVASIKRAKSVFITGAGSSYHAGLILKHGLNKEVKLRPDAILAGEFKEHLEFVDGNSVVIVISQSGETADVLEAVRGAKKRGAKILSIVNAAGSTLARESELTLLLNCGPEVGVAATKSFTAQVVVCNLIVDRLGERTNGTKANELGSLVGESLEVEPAIRKIASEYKDRSDFYFVARGLHYPVAMEGALKLKELSYIHAEGMPASELKHGTLALIESGTPVVVINPAGETHSDTLANAEELRARGAVIIGVSDENSEVYTHFVKIPTARAKYLPILEVIPLQLLAYYAAVERRNDPDYPRNLAKSVTVK